MSEFTTTTPEFEPNDPELFTSVFRKMTRFAIEHGYDFSAKEATDDDRQDVATWNEGGQPIKYWTEIAGPDNGIINDSKAATGDLFDYEIDGKDEILITVLGEGPSMKYGEYGSITLWDTDYTKVTQYMFGTKGVVSVDNGVLNTDDMVTYWEPTRQATDDELGNLARAFSHIEPRSQQFAA